MEETEGIKKFEGYRGDEFFIYVIGLFMALIGLTAFVWKNPGLGILVLMISGLILLVARKMQKTVRCYNVGDDGIMVDGSSEMVKYSEIVGIEPYDRRLWNTKMTTYKENLYFRLPQFATRKMHLAGISYSEPEVMVYTNQKAPLSLWCKCFYMTPIDRDGFIKAVEEKLAKITK